MNNEMAVKKEIPELNLEIIKKYICPTASEQEAYMFLRLCKAQNLNPFLREAYLIKYGTAAATIVTGKETFTKRADRLPQYDGFKAGIILKSNSQIIYREGSFYTSGEILLGGWAEVYRKDRSIPFRNEVKLEEYEGHTHTGEVNKMWREKKATMIRKVPLMQSLREAFPDEFGGMYSPEEINTVDTSNLPTYEMGQHPIIPAPAVDNPTITQPQAEKTETKTEAKAETTVNGDLFVKTTIEKTSLKTGKKNNKEWTLYGILAGGIWYNTFDKKLYETAEIQQNREVGIVYQATERGNNLIAINCEDSSAIPDNCTQNPVTCDYSSWEGKTPLCDNNAKCKYIVEVEEESIKEPW